MLVCFFFNKIVEKRERVVLSGVFRFVVVYFERSFRVCLVVKLLIFRGRDFSGVFVKNFRNMFILRIRV